MSPENSQGIIAMLIGLSAFVLLIACSNLANLLLVRSVARAREFAVRSSLGASRMALLRPLFVEYFLLALAGGTFAIQVALWTYDWLNGIETRASGDPLVFALDWRVLVWAFAACVFTALAFGIVPALFAVRLDINDTLKSGSRGTTGGRGYRRFRSALIVGQFAFAMILLAGAAMFARGVHEWNNRSFGWDATGLVTGSMLLPTAAYPGAREITEFQRLALERLETLPGVQSVSISYSMPFFGLAEPRKYVVAGREMPEQGKEPVAVTNGVSPHYFETVGTRVVSGRTFGEHDNNASPKVFIINEAMAQALFGTESPLGERIARAGGERLDWGEIVGVVGDIQAVASDRVAASFQVYQPVAQEPRHFNALAVRTVGNVPSPLVGSIRAAIMDLDPDLPVRDLQPAEIRIARARNHQFVIGQILSFLAALGLGLASVGIYGVVARTTAQRTGEFGIRLALGAQMRDIARLVLMSGAKLALIGCAIGAVGAVGVSRLIVAAFPGLQTSNVGVLAGVTVLLIAITQIGCYFPARRASHTSLTEALRTE